MNKSKTSFSKEPHGSTKGLKTILIQTALFLSHTERGGVFRVGSAHLSHAMDGMGITVAHISTPLSSLHKLAGRGSSRRKELASKWLGSSDYDGVLDFVPKTLLPAPFYNVHSLIKKLRLSGLGSCDVVFIDDPRLYHHSWKNFADTIIYRPTDFNLRPIPGFMEKRVLKSCDGVAATSLPVSEALKPLADVPHTVIPNGVDYTHFSKFADRCDRSGAVYVGALDERFSWSDVTDIARATPTMPIDLFGPLPKDLPENLPTTVHLRGPVDYDQLPNLLSKYKFGLLPLSSSTLNAGRSPMKLYEYISAGLAVISTSTPSLQSYARLPNVSLYGNIQDAIASIESWKLKEIDLAEAKKAGLAESWESKTTQLLEFADRLRRP